MVQVLFFGERVNLHAVWDDGMIDKYCNGDWPSFAQEVGVFLYLLVFVGVDVDVGVGVSVGVGVGVVVGVGVDVGVSVGVVFRI